MRSIPLLLVASIAIVSAASTPARADDPVYWQLQIERVELTLLHARDDLARVRARREWATRLPADEEIARLVGARGTDRAEDVSRTVTAELARCERDALEAERRVTLLELDLEEMDLSGRLPNTRLFAPLVKGRDFGTERQSIRIETARRVHEGLKKRFEMAEQLVDMRAVPWREMVTAANELDEYEAYIERIELEIDMRRMFLADSLPPDASFILQEESLIRRQRLNKTRQERARAYAEAIEPMVDIGVASQTDLDEAIGTVRRLDHEQEMILHDGRMFEHRYEVWEQCRGG